MPTTTEWPTSRDWDEAVAHDLPGAIVVVDLIYVDLDGQYEDKVQIYGVITVADKERGIAIECHGKTWNGEEHWLPPSTSDLQKAAPGEYHLGTTDEITIDPDYLGIWIITRRAEG
jgi:hypothetical protein